MTHSEPASAEASVTIDAAPSEVYALITDLPTLSALAEEATSMEWHRGDSVTLGAVFKGRNSNGGKTWTTTCTVTHADPARTFGFDVKSLVIPVSHWRYEIEPTEGGCRVTESTWDRRPGWFRGIAGKATGVPDRTGANAKHIRVTLERLKAKAEGR